MSVKTEIIEQAMREGNDFVEVIPGDDITRAAWRFERKVLEDTHEQSAAWRRFAVDNNLLDPFQIATGNDFQYFEPSVSFSQHITRNNQPVDVDEFDDGTVFLFKVFNTASAGIELLMSEYRMRMGIEEAIANDYFTAVIRNGILLISFIDPYIYINMSAELIPFLPREMSIATGQIITSGDTFVAGFYSLKAKV